MLCRAPVPLQQMEMNKKTSRKSSRSAAKSAAVKGLATSGVVERKEVERFRRQQMKGLCTKLASVMPKQHSSKERMTQPEILDAAVVYIKELRERVNELEQRKRSSTSQLVDTAEGGGGLTMAATTTRSSGGTVSEETKKETSETPVLVVGHLPSDGSTLDISLIGGTERPLKLHEVITVLEEEGAEVINANISVAGKKIFCTIHSKAFCSRIGIEVSRVSERLKFLLVTN